MSFISSGCSHEQTLQVIYTFIYVLAHIWERLHGSTERLSSLHRGPLAPKLQKRLVLRSYASIGDFPKWGFKIFHHLRVD